VAYADDVTADDVDPDTYRGLCEVLAKEGAEATKAGGMLWWLTSADHLGMTWEVLNDVGRVLNNRPVIVEEAFAQYNTAESRMTCDYRVLFPVVIGAERPKTWRPDRLRVPSSRQLAGDKRANPNGRVPGLLWRAIEDPGNDADVPSLWLGRRLQGTSVHRIDWHPTQLAPELLGRIMEGWTHDGDRVADLCAGSGSLARAAVAFGQDRDLTLVDQSGTYCDAMRREFGRGTDRAD
jgi:hypothetical protein